MLEFKVDGLAFDIFVPSKNLLIEFNGLKWHSRPSSRIRDLRKYKVAVSHQYDFVGIYEDEWAQSRSKVQNFLQNRIGQAQAVSIRPSNCKLRVIDRKQADEFLEKFHYIGAAKAKVNYGAFVDGDLVACASFKPPSRQSSHPWELARMAGNSKYRIHGIWSKLLQYFVRDHTPTSIVSFSDNRLFRGDVYSKIGFQFDGEVKSDYYWVKGGRRHHKSKLRKTTSEKLTGKTEVELREAAGYSRIWDVGKKRWVMRFE
jgi:hypothetical protein